MSEERKGELMVVLLSLLESSFPVLSIIVIEKIGALFSYAIVIAIAGAVLLALLAHRRALPSLFQPAAQRDLLLTAFFITLLFALMFLGLRYTTAGNAAVIIFLQLCFAYLYFNVLGPERLTPLHSAGALLMGLGALVMLWPESLRFNPGDLLILAAAAVAPLANLYQKRARKHVGSLTILTYRNLIALPVIVALAWSFEPLPRLSEVSTVLPQLLAIALLVYVAAKLLWVEALHRISITKISALTALLPLFTLVLAYAVLDEVPSHRQLLGILPILVGGYWITRPSAASAS